MCCPLLTAEGREQGIDGEHGNAVEGPNAGANAGGAEEHRAGVLHGLLAFGPNDLLQFAFHLTEPLEAVLLVHFGHFYTTFP